MNTNSSRRRFFIHGVSAVATTILPDVFNPIVFVSTQAVAEHPMAPIENIGIKTTRILNNVPAQTFKSSYPEKVAGVSLPTTEYAQLAHATALRASPEYLTNHCLRTFMFGVLIGRKRGLKVDYEVLFIACMLHDLGLTAAYRGPLPFEIEGANHAKSLLLEAGYSLERSELVWDGIAMHTQAIADYKRPEIMLVAAGAGVDVVGGGIREIPPEEVDEVLKTFPRLKMKEEFVHTCAEVAGRFPSGSARSFMRDVADRYLPDHHFANICDRIESAPFAE